MRRIFLLTLVFIVPIFIHLSYAFEIKEYFPLDEGNQWTYEIVKKETAHRETYKIEGTELVDEIETVKLVYSPQEYVCFQYDPEGVKKYKEAEGNEYTLFVPPQPLITNLGLGEERKSTIKLLDFENGNKQESELSLDMSLEKTENIKLPAGEFNNCLKFLYVAKEKDVDGSYETKDCSIWFAPGVGLVKESCFETYFDAEENTEGGFLITKELTSAVIKGAQIGSLVLSTSEGLPQGEKTQSQQDSETGIPLQP